MKELSEYLKSKPLTVYHGSWLDLGDIASLFCLSGARYADVSSHFASSALSGIIVHTNIGKNAEREIHKLKFPVSLYMGERYPRSANGGNYNDREDSPFYVSGYRLPVDYIRLDSYFDEKYSYTHPKTRKKCVLDATRVKFSISGRTVEILYVDMNTELLAEILHEGHVGVLCFYESNDEDSDTFRESLPKPLCDSEYIISARLGGGSSITGSSYYGVKDAVYRFDNYDFLTSFGSFPASSVFMRYYESRYPYLHRRYPDIAKKLLFGDTLDYTPFTVAQEGRLVFKKANDTGEEGALLRRPRETLWELSERLDEYAKSNKVFVCKMAEELGKIYIPLEKFREMGFERWFSVNADMYFSERAVECSRDCPKKKGSSRCKNGEYGMHACTLASPAEMIAICTLRHLGEPWAEDYARLVLR